MQAQEPLYYGMVAMQQEEQEVALQLNLAPQLLALLIIILVKS
jgi:hypothetical protein